MRVKPKQIIKELRLNGYRIGDTASRLQIHRTTVHRWFKSWKESIHKRRLDRLSTRPHTLHRIEFTASQKLEIDRYRKRTKRMAKKIAWILRLPGSYRTVHRFLKAKGLVREYGYHRRPKWQNTVHMHAKNTPTIGYLQFDVKYITPELSGLPWTCFEYAVIDIFSRYKEVVILNQLDQDGSMVALLEILPRLPFKTVFIQTDNGLEFQKRFDDMLIGMGIKHHWIHKSTPNENAVIERSFRTDEEEFYFRIKRRPKHYDELRDLYKEFLHYYNHERLHMGIDLKTPAEIVAKVMGD